MKKTYLGDGVYAEFDGWVVQLTTEDGIRTTNTIFLEPEVFLALKQFVEQIKTQMKEETKE